MGTVHYGMYLGICLIGRWVAGIGVLPGMIESPNEKPFVPPAASLREYGGEHLCFDGIGWVWEIGNAFPGLAV